MSEELRQRIIDAHARQVPLRIRGGGTKDFYGQTLQGEILDTRVHAGVIDYEPSELVLTARSGTPLRDVESLLLEQRQRLAFEPPHFGTDATLGGCIAAGLSGPARSAAGALRDFVLGAHIIDGRGQALAFGGRVMKNVAGYDVSRVFAGSLGTMGLILDISLKVLPCHVAESTLLWEMGEGEALERLRSWAREPVPITASAWHDGMMTLRLGGARAAVDAFCARAGGDSLPDQQAQSFWQALREQRLPFFSSELPLWRLSLPAASPPVKVSGMQFIEWSGALRWLTSDAPAATIRAAVNAHGGHATLFRRGAASADDTSIFEPLAPGMAKLHQRLKAQFDPSNILNRGRMYADW